MFLARKLTGIIYSTKQCFRQQYQVVRSIYHAPTPTEISIDVPWGRIAGLHWNDSHSAIPILCLHGWKDNAASFNRLIPEMLKLTPKFQFIAIDLPGHGYSSYYPEGMMYQAVDSMMTIRRIIRHFGWPEKAPGIHLMGHSLGAILSFLFASSHPNLVDCVIAIDGLVPVMFTNSDMVHNIQLTTEGVLQTETNKRSGKSPKTFTKKELHEKMLNSHMQGFDKVSCDTLFTRAIVESPPNSGRFKFAHDPRVQYFPLLAFSAEQIQFLAECFRSNLLHIQCENGVDYLSDYMQSNLKIWLAKNNKKVLHFAEAPEATHHVHLGEPEKVVDDIVNFLHAVH